MNYNIIILSFLFTSLIKAQSAEIKGFVVDQEDNPISLSTVRVIEQSKYTVTDQKGFFQFKSLQAGNIELKINSLGFKQKIISIKISPDETQNLKIVLIHERNQIDEVVINADSRTTKQSKKAIKIESLNAITEQQKPIRAQDLLRRASGVLVRQQGGFGSEVNVNLNGLTGDAVRIYYDGMPLEVFGNALTLNNLPINLIERIEVFKGIMPIEKGTDALGGGINLVPKKIKDDFLDVNYQISSFNTHQLNTIYRKKINEKLTLGGMLIGSYSDNNYEMQDIPNLDITTDQDDSGNTITIIDEELVDVKRFHDQHESILSELNLQLKNTFLVDRLDFSMMYSYRFDEFQHGRRVTSRPAGEADRENNGLFARLKLYKKISPKIDIEYNGLLTYTDEKVRDSTQNLYDWFGNIQPISNNRNSEILPRPSLRNGFQNNNAHRLTANYEINNDHKLTLSNYLDNITIDGNDPAGIRLDIDGELIDPTTFESNYRKNIAGIQLSSKWIDDKLSSTIFYKNYFYEVDAIDFNQTTGSIIPKRKNQDNFNGFGLGVKYNFTDDFFIRSSFEQTTRLPSQRELFGNFLSILSNTELAPEESDNFNVGTYYKLKFDKSYFLSFDINAFMRDQSNLIRLRALNVGDLAQYINEDEVGAEGIELNIKTNLNDVFSFKGNFTYQKIKLESVINQQNQEFIGAQLPNIPDFFYNVEAKYEFSDLIIDKDQLDTYVNFYYVDPFSVTFILSEGNANEQNIVPQQEQLNFGFTYYPYNTKFSISGQVNNLLDNRLFDNFRVPRPGINFALKINYQII